MNATQETITIETSDQLQKRLAAQGDSLYSFATRHAFNYRTVCVVAQRWWHRSDRKPHGGIARDIIEKMQAEFSHD